MTTLKANTLNTLNVVKNTSVSSCHVFPSCGPVPSIGSHSGSHSITS